MSERPRASRGPRNTIHEIERAPITHDYRAVPLAPRTATDVESIYRPYVQASVERMTTKTEAAVDAAEQKGWVSSPDLKAALTEIIATSLYDSQMMRIWRNDNSRVLERVDPNDPRVTRALEGTAMPHDLFGIFSDYLLDSIEVAKLSHPLDAAATEEMDRVVYDAMLPYCDPLEDSEPYYKTKSEYLELPAVTVLQKQHIGARETPYGTVRVVRRKAYLVRGDAEAGSFDPYLDRKVRNSERHADELYPKIDGYLRNEAPEQRWLQPLSTSYYAYYDLSDLTSS